MYVIRIFTLLITAEIPRKYRNLKWPSSGEGYRDVPKINEMLLLTLMANSFYSVPQISVLVVKNAVLCKVKI